MILCVSFHLCEHAPRHRIRGVGYSYGTGHEQCSARITPDGELELRIGAHSHGQGLETTLAQVAHEILLTRVRPTGAWRYR